MVVPNSWWTFPAGAVDMGYACRYPAGRGLPGLWLPHLMTHILGGIQVHLPTSRPEPQSLPHQPRQLGCRPQDTWRKRPGPGPGPPGGRGMWSFSIGSGWHAEGSATPPTGGSSMTASPSLVWPAVGGGPVWACLQLPVCPPRWSPFWTRPGLCGSRQDPWGGTSPPPPLPGMAGFPSCPHSASQLSAGWVPGECTLPGAKPVGEGSSCPPCQSGRGWEDSCPY